MKNCLEIPRFVSVKQMNKLEFVAIYILITPEKVSLSFIMKRSYSGNQVTIFKMKLTRHIAIEFHTVHIT